MGKGRDKRKKNEDPAKAAKRVAKQAQKLAKCGKRSGGETAAAEGFNNEEPIEVTLKRIQKAESRLRTVEEVANVPPPTPRANAVFTACPERDHELLLFGGEFWDGEKTVAYNDTYFYHLKRNTWSRLSSAVNPAPRSSSQGVVYKHYLVLFGGEFVSQSQSQYLHFRDVWRYDTRRSEWEEMKLLKGGPSSRSGHRMVMWRRNAVVFGGFYDNAQECRYFNDLWILSQMDGSAKWCQVKVDPVSEAPHPRSGHNMAVYGDGLFVYGGYSTEKFNRFKKSEATVHHDLWTIRLPQESSAELPMWTKIRLSGVPPPIRSGVACASREKKMYLFGGVVDIESPGGKMVSTFSNDLFVFHMDTKRFYPVVLRRAASKAAPRPTHSAPNDLQAELQALQLAAAQSDGSSSDEEVNLSEEDEPTGAVVDSKDMRESYETNKAGQVYPHRRMDASMLLHDNQLYIFGGQFESDRKEITMADLFVLNLNRLDTYRVLLSQDLSAAVWMGKGTESKTASWESGSTLVSAAFDVDYDDNEEEEEEEEEETGRTRPSTMLDDSDDGDEAPEAIPAELDTYTTPGLAEVAEAIEGITTTRGRKGLKVHKEQLLAQLSAAAAVPTPTKDEDFAQFYRRTTTFWEATARESYDGKRSDRKMQREAAEFARRRYHEARELLHQLHLVEEREAEEARFFRERRRQKELEWEAYEQGLENSAKEGTDNDSQEGAETEPGSRQSASACEK